jgi:hypothetical protein
MILTGSHRGVHALRRIALACSIVCAAGFALVVRPVCARAAADPSARLLASSASGVTFEVDVPTPHVVPVPTLGGTFHRLDLDGFAREGTFGKPALPARTVWIAVPEGAQVFVSASGDGERLYDGLRLLPAGEGGGDALASTDELAPLGGANDAATLPPAPYTDRVAYQATGSLPVSVASLTTLTHMRAQRIARITVRPAAYDAALGRLRVYTRVLVNVRFAGGRPTSDPAAPSGSTPDAFEDVYAGLLNYESGRAWRTDLAAGSLRRQGLVPNAVNSAGRPSTLAARDDFSASPNWVKLTVHSKGLYRVDATDLAAAGVNVATIDPRTLRVFTRAGLPVVDEVSPPAGWLSELAINVVGEGDGTFDPTDYVQMVGLGASGWRDDYGAPPNAAAFFDHPYDSKNTYWLTWGGTFSSPPRRWATRSGAPEDPSAVTATDYPARLHFELDTDYRPSLQEGGQFFSQSGTFWEKWFWFNVTDGMGAVQFGMPMPGVVTAKPARLTARLWGNSHELIGSFGVADHYLNVGVNGQQFGERAFYGTVREDYDTTFTPLASGNRMSVQNRLVHDPSNSGRSDNVEVAWFNVEYARTLTPVSDTLDFRSPDTTGAFAYGVGPFASAAGLTLLDTTDPLSPVQITGFVARDTTGGKAIYFDDPAVGRRAYLALSSNGVKHPDATERVQIDDLLAPGNGADYVVITYDGFTDAAQALANFRATRLAGVANPRTRVVKISDIYAWYSGGRVDPVAVRNFLYDTIKRLPWSPAPAYVCLLGDASFDYKNIYHLAGAGQPTNFVPTYPNGWQTGQFSTDDWLVDMDLGVNEPWPGGPPPGYPDSVGYDVPDLAVGRLPASTASDADFLVNGKIIPYEKTPTFGEWRLHGLLVGDDVTQGFVPDPLGTQHMFYSENICNVDIPVTLFPDKIYLIQYPYGSGSEKPGVNKDVKAAVNGGVLFWNYIGHGNPFKMADENAFILSDVGALTNIDKLTLLVAASCDLGRFDDAIVTGLGETLLKARNGGVVASFSATDIAFAASNVALAEALFQAIFAEGPAGFTTSLGKAVLKAKTRPLQLSVNDLKYVLMGDPGTRLGEPEEYVRLGLTDALTNVAATTLTRGRRLLVSGTVSPTHDPLATDVDAGFNGTAAVYVTDSPPHDTATAGRFDSLAYRYNPGVIFHGDVPVTNGHFSAQFIVPLEAATGDKGKVTVYANTPSLDAGGAVFGNVVNGVAATVDTTGPTIALAFTNGLTHVPADATLRVAVSDQNGVNLTGHTVPNALFLTVDDVTRFDLTKDFRYDAGSYQSGSVLFQLPGLPPGPHSITVSAADNFAQGVLGRKNRSTATIDFVVEDVTGLSLGAVYNFPNPFAPGKGTTFVLAGLTENARILVKVYSVSGSLVRILETTGGPGQVQIPWDGRDERGDRIANGAYLYLVQAEGLSSGNVVRFRGRAAVLH